MATARVVYNKEDLWTWNRRPTDYQGEVIRRAMRKLCVKERLVSAVVTVQELCIVRTGYGNGEVLEVGVGAHQGSGLSPLLFPIVMTAISRVSGWFTLEIAICR